jgi:hypothetical protein
VRVYDFAARLVAKFDGVVGDVVWLDWTHDGRELVALSDDGTMTRWLWESAQLIDASGSSIAEHGDYAPAGVLDEGNDCGQDVVAEHRHTTGVEARETNTERLVIDSRKSLLACISDGTFHRSYDYLLDTWQASDMAPINGTSAMCFRGNNITSP